MRSLFLLVLLLFLIEGGNAVTGGPFTQLGHQQTTVSGSIAPGQVFFYNFNGFVSGSCWGLPENATFDAYFGYFAENGTLLTTGDYSVSGIVEQSGNVKIGVTGYGDSSFTGSHSRSGTFLLNLNVSTKQEDGDNTFQTAVKLPSGERNFNSSLLPLPSVLGSTCTLGDNGDVDFVTFTLPVGSCWSTQISRNFDEIFGLFAPNGTLIETADSSLSGLVDSSGQVTIAISGWNDNKFIGDHTWSGGYNLTIVVQNTGEQNDNTFATRNKLLPGVTLVSGDMWAITGSCQLGDVDFYEFTLPAGVCAQTSMQRNFDEVLGLFAQNGTQLQYQDSQITTKVDVSGKLVIAVSGWADTQFKGTHSYSGNYNLTINTFQATQDGDNVFQNATVVNGQASRSYVSQLDANQSPCTANGDVDFVQFTHLPAGNCFYTLMNRTFDEILGWFNSSGGLIQYQDSQVVGKVPADGIVTIAVSGWADTSFIGAHSYSGNYNLTIVTVAPTASDGNDNLANRTVLASGVTLYSSDLAPLGAAPCNIVGDVDFVEFQVQPGACFSTGMSSTFDDMVGWVDATNGSILTVHDSGSITGITPTNGKLVLAVTGYPDYSLIGEHSLSGNYNLSVQVSVPQTDASETLQTPVFVPGNSVNSDLYLATPGCGTGDKDFWLFILPAGACFHVVENATFDEYLGAFTSDGTQLAGGDSSVSGFVPQSGVLMIGVTGWPDTGFTGAHSLHGTYRVQVDTQTITADNDNTYQTRKFINNAAPLSGTISSYTYCSGSGDIDFVTYTNLTPGACYQSTMVSNFTYVLGRFNDSGNLIDYTYSSYTDIVPASGQVTFAISGSGDTSFTGAHTSNGAYTLSLNVTIIPTVVDGNDNFSSPSVVPVNQTTFSGDLFAVPETPCTANRKSDVDYVRFTISPNCYVNASLHSTFDGILGYFNSNGSLNRYINGGTLPEIKADETGVLTYAVTAWPDTTFVGQHSKQGTYNITLATDCGNAPHGFNRVRGGAQTTSGNLASGAVDRWTFEQQPVGACFQTVMDTSFDAVLGWYNDNGSLTRWDDNAITAIVPTGSQVNIAVSGWADTSFVGDHTNGGPYTLSLSITQNQPPPPSDGNDSFQQRLLVNGTQVSGSIWASVDQTPCPYDVNTVNDVDYFQFNNLTAGYCVATRMNETFDSALALLSSNGTILDWQDYTLYTIVPSEGTVYIAVTGYPDRNLTGAHQKNGDYTLNLDLTHQQTPPAADGNNLFVTPTIVSLNTLTVSGSIWSLTDQTPCPNDFTAAGDVDFYRFGPLTVGYCFQTQISSTFDEYLGWFNNQGVLIHDDDYQITGNVPSDGFVYIAVTGYPDRTFNGSHSSNGNYNLTLKLSHNTPPPASDGNNAFANSTKLPVGQTTVSGSIWSTSDVTPCPNDDNKVMDVDFYTFQGLEPGSCFQVDEDADFDEVIGLFNKSGALVDWADYSLLGHIPSDGVLHLAVSGYPDTTFVGNHQKNGNYTLRLAITRNDEPIETHDNVFVDRVVLPSGVNKISGDIWYIRDRTPCPNDLPPSDVDFFTFTGFPAGTCFRTSTDTNFDTIIAWYGDDGLISTWADSEIYGVIPPNGIVNLALSGWADWYFIGSHTNGGRYTVTLLLDENCGTYGNSEAGQALWCGDNCGDRLCGDNGCGGSCGTCSQGYSCLYEGVCSLNCTSVCTQGQQCGYDGCGGYCGTCTGQDVCSGGQCVCVPDCSGRVCGDDGCGGSCGTCTGRQEQCFDGQCLCVANCTGFECGNDGCGGICGVCGPYYTCGDQHSCIRDPLTQPSCDDYFGFPHQEVNLVLLNEVNQLLREKILETIDSLELMRDALLSYNPDSQLLDLASLIDQIHLFCSGPYHNDTCLSVSEFEFIETAFLNAIHHVTIDPLAECAGRVCGTTSYGGSCGACPPGQQCSEDGQCLCAYDCSGRECGYAAQEDGTSFTLCSQKSCGACQDRYQCTDYQCTPIPHVPVTLRILDCSNGYPVNVTGNIHIWMDAGPIAIYPIDPNGPVIPWVPEEQEGTWSFGVEAIGYVSLSQDVRVEWETTSIDFCLNRDTVTILLQDVDTGLAVATQCQTTFVVNVEAGSMGFAVQTPPNPFIFTIPDYGYGEYSFNVNCLGYDVNVTSALIEEPTENVTIQLSRTPVVIQVVDCDSTLPLGVDYQVSISATFNPNYAIVINVPAQGFTNWVAPWEGTYDFGLSAVGYISAGESREIQYNTSTLLFCLTRHTFFVAVREYTTNSLVSTACTVEWAPGTSVTALSLTPPNPFQLSVPDNGYGNWTFHTECTGFVPTTVSAVVTDSTSLVEIYVLHPLIHLEVREEFGNNSLITVPATIQISQDTQYNQTYSWFPDRNNTWSPTVVGNMTFVTTVTGYLISQQVLTVTTATTQLVLYVTRPVITIEIREGNQAAISVPATIHITQGTLYDDTFNWTPDAANVWQPSIIGDFTFVTTASGYLTDTSTYSILADTNHLVLYLERPTVVVEVRESVGTQVLIRVPATVQISLATYNQTFSWLPDRNNTWVPPTTGNFTFVTTADGYSVSQEVRTVTTSTTILILYVHGCGDHYCSNGETFDTCPQDCAALSLQFERYDSNSPVSGYTVTTYSENPRNFSDSTGPVFNNQTALINKTLPVSSNVIVLDSFNHNQTVYLRVEASGYIFFYWTADLSTVDPNKGLVFNLRGHLSPTFTSSNLPYRVVNTWRTTDNEPAPYSPTDLNLHLFFSDGSACDINNKNVTSAEALICQSVADAKQAGGPASIDFSLVANQNITLWNSKPPRDSHIAPSQAGRYLVDSGSYIVLYGITSDAATGKQLGEVLLSDALRVTTPLNTFDLWRQADISVAQPRQSGLQITPRNSLGAATIDQEQNMIFDCQISPVCSHFVVPYADTGR